MNKVIKIFINDIKKHGIITATMLAVIRRHAYDNFCGLTHGDLSLYMGISRRTCIRNTKELKEEEEIITRNNITGFLIKNKPTGNYIKLNLDLLAYVDIKQIVIFSWVLHRIKKYKKCKIGPSIISENLNIGKKTAIKYLKKFEKLDGFKISKIRKNNLGVFNTCSWIDNGTIDGLTSLFLGDINNISINAHLSKIIFKSEEHFEEWQKYLIKMDQKSV